MSPSKSRLVGGVQTRLPQSVRVKGTETATGFDNGSNGKLSHSWSMLITSSSQYTSSGSHPLRKTIAESLVFSRTVSLGYGMEANRTTIARGKHLSHQRGKRNTNPGVSLLKIEGVDDPKAAS